MIQEAYNPGLNLYFSHIRANSMLSREEEVDLVRLARAGDLDARDRLIQANLGFVVKVAKDYRNLGVPFEELINEGNLGLIEAVRRFDTAKGVKFITCAIWWIRKSILAAINDQSRLVRIPASRKCRTLESKESLTVSDGEAGLADRLVQPADGSPERTLIAQQEQELMNEAVDRLSGRERRVIGSRYGLQGESPRPLRDIGEELGISRERVRQIEVQAIQRLRRILAARQGAALCENRVNSA